jgi:ATP-dependent RNA helicase RhlE
MTFEHLSLIEPVYRALKQEGYTVPTPIQQKAIPVVLQQRDLMGCAQTGTGKTAAFVIPILQLLHNKENSRGHIQALILAPTRELSIQIGESVAAYGRYTGLRHTTIYGGVSQQPQETAIRKGVDILIATPGRLIDLVNQGVVNLQHIKIFVLDEADHMLDMGFIRDIKKIIARLPVKKQTLFFSATIPPAIETLAGSILVNPVKVAVTPVSSAVNTISQSVYFIEQHDKRLLLTRLLNSNSSENVLVFTRTKHSADRITRELLKSGINAAAIHGNKSQNARQRALAAFKDKQLRVLVATDIAARGIDIDKLALVINYEIPNTPETYVHRIGRTGRAGMAGQAISFCNTDEKKFLKDIQKLTGCQIPVITESGLTAGINNKQLLTQQQGNNTVKAHTGTAKIRTTGGLSHTGNTFKKHNSAKKWWSKKQRQAVTAG